MKTLWLWFSAAATIFANGFLHGLAAGTAATVALLKAGAAPKIALASGLSVAASNGGKRVVVWSDNNPIPNPFPGFVPQPDPEPAKPEVPAASPAPVAPSPVTQ